MENRFKSIHQFIRALNKNNKKLLNDFIDNDYISGVRTGRGKRQNFLKEHNSQEGIKIVQEILKFKRIEKIAEKTTKK